MSIGPRNFFVTSQLYVRSSVGNPQAAAAQAVTAIKAALAGIDVPCAVAFSAQYEDGAYVIAQDGAVACQLLIEQVATMADAQAAAEEAVAAIGTALSALPASFLAEQEGGAYVFAEPG